MAQSVSQGISSKPDTTARALRRPVSQATDVRQETKEHGRQLIAIRDRKCAGGWSKVSARFAANKLTASSSITAEHGSRCQAIRTFASYAGISEATRNRQPMLSAASEANIRRGLHKTRAPQKAGSILWPIAKTMVERNPTVRACREAPQMPPLTSFQEARMDKAAG